MTLPFKDVSIITQCAFKGAVEAGDDVTTDDGLVNFNARFAILRETLFDAVNAETEARGTKPSAPPPAVTPRSTEAALADELGAVTHVTVVNDSQGPLPAWLLKACEADGVSEVFDNRADPDLVEKKRPWFRATDDFTNPKTGKPFAYWPPKKGGR